MSPGEEVDAVAYAATAVDTVVRQIADGEKDDPAGDLVDRCTHYYARGLGITPQQIAEERQLRTPGR